MAEFFERINSKSSSFETGAVTNEGNDLILYAENSRELCEDIDKAIERVCKTVIGVYVQKDYIEKEWGKFVKNFQYKSKRIRVVQHILRSFNLEIGAYKNCEIAATDQIIYDVKWWLLERFMKKRSLYLTDDEIFINDVLHKVNCSRGAPMGRINVGDSKPNWKPVIVRKVELVYDGVYDIGGVYWGSPNNLWVEFTLDLDYIFFYRKER